MTTGNYHFPSSPSLPNLRALQRRQRELLARHRNQPANMTASPGDPVCEHEPAPATEEPTLVQENQQYQPYEQPAEASPPFIEQPSAPLPPQLNQAALYGLAGRVVRSLVPHTEADPAAILLQFLTAVGNLAGPAPHCRVGDTRHGLNLFIVLVGESSKARKGTSWRQIASLFTQVDPAWAARRIATARPTANNILHAVRLQHPVDDRRLFLLAEEFASVLHLLGRETGQLSPLLRQAWDGGDLSLESGHHSIATTAAHISLVGHVTQSELAHHLSRNESHNGFANRCLWTSVYRSKSLPEGGSLPPDQLASLAHELRRILDWIATENQLCFSRSPAARALWNDRYANLSQGRQDVYGAATSRGEAQVLRLSAIYAALDRSLLVEESHLQAALAVWEYCLASARLLFDTAPIDPTARRISQAIDLSPQGLTRGQVRALFHSHVSKDRIDLALEQLMNLGLIHHDTLSGRGRPSTLWVKAATTSPAEKET